MTPLGMLFLRQHKNTNSDMSMLTGREKSGGRFAAVSDDLVGLGKFWFR